MKTFFKYLGGATIFSLVLGLSGPLTAHAATTPSLGSASAYGVLAGTYTNTSAATTITGSVGFSTGPAQAPLGVHATYGAGVPTPQARIDAANVLANDLAPQDCTFDFPGGAVDLSTDGPNGATGVYAPGVYCGTGAMNIGVGGIDLTGSGTYIFRTVGALTSTAGSNVTLIGASACDVFWTPTAATTLAANTTFSGTIIDNANAITVGANTVWNGRAISLGAGTVTTGNTSTITAPVCSTPSGGQNPQVQGTINLVKVVINDNGGTKRVSDFPLFANDTPVVSGDTVIFPGNATYTVTETNTAGYTQSFSGDCDATGHIGLDANEHILCIITNNDIGTPVVPPVPPLIDIVKVPNPLALPYGAGPVTYTYTLRNVGTVPVSDITMIGDSCRPIVLASGDTNSNSILDLPEVWVYQCSRTLAATHTNTVVASGLANGIRATDVASATVVVGEPLVPPLIHVTKIPNPLTLPAGGGIITYNETVTNPGTVPLSNVELVDDKCAPMIYRSGDLNSDSKLDPNESWKYVCASNLTETTLNTASATGEANGFVVRDIALATVLVAAATPAPVVIPTLPSTGTTQSLLLSSFQVIAGSLLGALVCYLVMRKKQFGK